MESAALPFPKRAVTSKQAPRRRFVLYIFVVLIIASIMILSLVSIGLFAPEAEVEITSSSVRSSSGPSANYIRVSVDVTLYNPGRRRRTTVWAEITDQPTNVSFSKTQSVEIGYRESETMTIEFILDSLIYYSEFTHRVWLTYPNSQDLCARGFGFNIE